MAKTSYASVPEYLAQLSEPGRSVLTEALAVVAKAAPRAERAISYQIPAFKLDGRVLLFMAAWKEHYSLYPVTAGMLAAFGREIAACRDGKGTLRFSFAEPIPRRLLTGIAKIRTREVEAAEQAKAKKRAKKSPKKAAKKAPKKSRKKAAKR